MPVSYVEMRSRPDQAADADTPLPRNVLPRQPEATDPYLYRDPKRD